MARQGRSTIDFGAAPGTGFATVTITGQAGIAADSLVEAWLIAEATADHSIEDHVIDGPQILAGAIVPGIGFTIYGASRPDQPSPGPVNVGPGTLDPAKSNTPSGQWSVGWVWN